MKVSVGELKEYVEYWYNTPLQEKSAMTLLKDLEDPSASGIGSLLMAYILCLLGLNGEDYKNNDTKFFRTEMEAYSYAKTDGCILGLFELYRVATI